MGIPSNNQQKQTEMYIRENTPKLVLIIDMNFSKTLDTFFKVHEINDY